MAPDPIPITINGKTVDPTSPDAPPEFSSLDASRSNYILIQCVGLLSNQQKEELKELRVVIQEYVSQNTYLCRYEPPDLAKIQAMDYVVHTSVYSPQFVVHSSLLDTLDAVKAKTSFVSQSALKEPPVRDTGGDAGRQYSTTIVCLLSNTNQIRICNHPIILWKICCQFSLDSRQLASTPRSNLHLFSSSLFTKVTTVYPQVDIILHEGADHSPEQIEQLLKSPKYASPEDVVIGRRHLRLTVEDTEQLEAIAALDSVKSIELVLPLEYCNDVACQLVRAVNTPSRPSKSSGDASSSSSSTSVASSNFKGQDQIVIVADSGFDTGDISSAGIHPAFAGRVDRLYPMGRTSPAKCNDEATTHGTHICGSVAGSYYAQLAVGIGGGRLQNTRRLIEGPAPQAHLAVQCLWQDAEHRVVEPTNPIDLYIKGPYEDFEMARIHCNSWGVWNATTNQQSAYGTNNAGAIDSAVWLKKDLLILRAAGNNGLKNDTAQIGGYAAAKNCITVGNSGTLRPHSGDMADYDMRSMTPSNSRSIWRSSSRGPTAENRMKPDIVAPGTCILSTSSRDPQLANLDPNFTLQRQGVMSDGANGRLWCFKTGTSMAAGLVAGSAAVLRQVLLESTTLAPTAALLKALLIHGAEDLSGGVDVKDNSTITPAPNPVQGFGRLDLTKSIGLVLGANPFLVAVEEMKNGRNGDTFKRTFYLAKKTSLIPTLKATLVWTDQPGDQLQNKLWFSAFAQDSTRIEKRRGNKAASDATIFVKDGPGKPGDAPDGPERFDNDAFAEPVDGRNFDQINNVQQIIWHNIPTGPVQLRVTIHMTTVPEEPEEPIAPFVLIREVTYSDH